MTFSMEWTASKPVLWTGLVGGWIGLSVSANLPPHWREAAFFFGWAAFILAWTRLSPCAGGACSTGACAAPTGKD
jgi:hypothetical protein